MTRRIPDHLRKLNLELDLMNYAESILPEFDREMANTRKVLERVPEDKLDWQAHPKSHTIGWNANHLAEILGWVEGVLTAPSWDIAPVGCRDLFGETTIPEPTTPRIHPRTGHTCREPGCRSGGDRRTRSHGGGSDG